MKIGNPTDADKTYWRARQDALPCNWIPDVLQPHEIRFYERFTGELGQKVALIPRPAYIPGVGRFPENDFVWLNNGLLICELKSNAAKYSTIQEAIRSAVVAARKKNHIKENFIIDLGYKTLSEKLRNQLCTMNARAKSFQIAALWVVHKDGIEQITLA